MATQYNLLTFKGDKGKPTPGILVDNQVVNLTKIRKTPVDTTSTLTLLEKWATSNRWLRKLAAEVAAGKHKAACKPRSRTTLLPPLMYPGNIFCIASNYVAHRAEMGNKAPMPDKKINAPVFFLKTPRQVVVGEGAKIHLPRTSTAIDWESEVAVVIGLHYSQRHVGARPHRGPGQDAPGSRLPPRPLPPQELGRLDPDGAVDHAQGIRQGHL